MAQHFNTPTIFVVFGATGDLMGKKIVPSLFHLFNKNKLPAKFSVVGFSRQALSDEAFGRNVFVGLTRHKDADVKSCEAFCGLFSYHQGLFQEKAGYVSLAKRLKAIDDSWGMCTNKLFYLAVPPQFYETILQNLASSGLTKPCSDEDGWSRILIEKPFGKDLETAKALDTMLGTLFREEQIYRIDHYLAKEMLQNILSFRFSNTIFEHSWDESSIEKIEIRLSETGGVEERGNFYDGVGALRDVGQNHMLQMLALLTMEHPVNFESSTIRKKRAEILNTLIPPPEEEITRFTFRSQYEGYRDIRGVNPKSNTETYFKIRAFLSSPRWSDVPIIFDSGKRLKEQKKEIEITFKHPQPCLCPPRAEEHYANTIVISLEPEEAIAINFWSKKPGLEFEMERRTFTFSLREKKHGAQYTEEYEKLLLDAIEGDQTLFVSTAEIAAMWRFIDPIANAWQRDEVPLTSYLPNTDTPILDSSFINKSAPQKNELKKEIGIIGLGKMGGNLSRRLIERGWTVAGFNRTPEATRELENEGLSGSRSVKELCEKFSTPRVIWLMVPAGKPVDEVLFGEDGLVQYLNKGDIVVDGGNSFYKDSVARFKKLKEHGIDFVDVGVSGGPEGARYGASLMIGGERRAFEKLEALFYDIAEKSGYQFFEGAGAGHFVKMIHNGIEYGMMQAIAEGFTILEKAKYKLNLPQVADIYNHGSVIESRLVGWLKNAFESHGDDLQNVSGSVAHTGEGEWTVKTAKELKIRARVIEEALQFRVESEKDPSYTGKIVSALREQFGGHQALLNNKHNKQKPI